VVNQLTSDTPLENLYSRTGKLLLLYEGTGDPLHAALAELYTRWVNWNFWRPTSLITH